MFTLQLCSTHFCTALGEGHRPVNCPTRPLSATEIAAFLGRQRGREISWMSTSFLMNFEFVGLFQMVAFLEMREAKISAWSSLSCIWEESIPAMERLEGNQL